MTLPFELMHLADSALPAGGFAFSNGMESAVKLGLISDYQSLVNYLEAFVRQVGDFDVPFIQSLLTEDGDKTVVLNAYDAMTPLPVMRRAGRIQGRGLLRLMKNMYPELGMEQVGTWFGKEGARWHYLPVFSLCMKQLDCPEEDIVRLYIFMTLRDQISAAIRLGLAGPMDGHVLQRHLYNICESVRLKARGRTWQNAVKTCPAMELAQGYHESIYSKLFQN